MPTKRVTTRDKGRDAEQDAVDFLTRRGYRILDRNFTCKIGEIDVIAEHDGEVVFVEVRSSRAGSLVDPAYSVNRTKQRKIIRTAQVYLARRFQDMPPCRFDVVLIRRGQDPEIELIPRAFEADSRCSGF